MGSIPYSSPTATRSRSVKWTLMKRIGSAIGQTRSESLSQPVSAEDWYAGGFGIYIHWPFCSAKCPYCDFNSHVVSHVDQERWGAAYLREIARIAAEVPGRTVHSIFFGGGTPSLMEPSLVGRILDGIALHWDLAEDLEVTLEANPTSVEAERFRGFRSAGVNRLSLGVQALNDADLRALGRMHTTEEALRAFGIARETFSRISFDLIYARQHQSLSDWRTELHRAIAEAVDHLSLYQLTIEPGTRFGELAARNRLRGLPDDDRAADMYADTQELLKSAGLPAYEISNHARPGAECRHNLVYWRYGDYVGIGPGSHGRLTLDQMRVSTRSESMPGAWLEQVERNENGEVEREALDSMVQAEEMVLMGLRLSEGIDTERFFRLSGRRLDDHVIGRLIEEGFLSAKGHRIRLTQDGRPVANAVIKNILFQ